MRWLFAKVFKVRPHQSRKGLFRKQKMTRAITIAEATSIARKVLRYLNSVDSRTVDMEDQINGHLAECGLGWKLKDGTYIDGIACQFVGQLAKDIRASAVEKH
jgi:hypothetical protein